MEEQLLVDLFDEDKKHWWHIAKRALVRQFVVGSNLDILVAGVGGGMICKELKACGHTVLGIDISSASCEYVSNSFGIEVFNTNLEKPLQFNDESFDIIIIADVLEHLDNDKQLLQESFRCLKPNGRVIITVPAYQHMWSNWDTRVSHKRRYLLDTLKGQVLEAGLSIKKASYFHMLLYPFVYFYRKVFFVSKGKGEEKSDFSAYSNGALSGFINFYYFLERELFKIINLPFGLSIFIVGEKNGFKN
ncbi:MAG TPA: methyltransferase domain-containing protein [Candidatus Omnitrophota bacterium]|nr:methyltransferase domain-containing protein [Candidatus Omnitrophota bacterium]